jgi:rhodanese-related sulfurtransferase
MLLALNMMATRRFVCLSFMSALAGKDIPAAAAAAFLPTTIRHSRATFVTSSTLPIFMAAPGVQVSEPALIQKALQDPHVTIVDVRSLDELKAKGYWKVTTNNNQQSSHVVKWVHAQCTLETGCPLLSMASDSLLPNKDAPVVLYCASGKRAGKAQQVLTDLGYTNVLNAGAFPSDTDKIIQEY